MNHPVANPTALREAILELMVTAALANHNLTPFHPIPSGGYQSRCRRCHQTAWAGETGLIYSLLAAPCPLEAV